MEEVEKIKRKNSDDSSDIEPDSLFEDLPHEIQQTLDETNNQQIIDYSTDEDHVEEDVTLEDHSHQSDDDENESNLIDDNELDSSFKEEYQTNERNRSSESTKSVSYFVELPEKIKTNRSSNSNTYIKAPMRSDPAHRMTKSMYSRSESRTSQSSVSFFVDFSNNDHLDKEITKSPQVVKSAPVSGVRKKPQQIIQSVRSPNQINNFFKKIKEFIHILGMPCFSREEVKKKLILASNVKSLLKNEEKRLQSGLSLTIIDNLDPFELAQEDYGNSSTKPDQVRIACEEPKPCLRRERTFDLTPKEKLADLQVIDISLNDSNESRIVKSVKLSSEQDKMLEMFQQQVKIHSERLQSEHLKLLTLEHKYVTELSKCGPQRIHCWEDDSSINSDLSNSMSSLTCSESGKQAPKPVPRPRTRVPAKTPSKIPVRPSRRCDLSLKGDSLMSQSCYASLSSDKGSKDEFISDRSFFINPNGRTRSKDKYSNIVTTLAAESNNLIKRDGRKFHLKLVNDSEKNKKQDQSLSCSWFIPNSTMDNDMKSHETSCDSRNFRDVNNGAGDFLIRQFQNRKKGKDKSRAFFISCDDNKDQLYREINKKNVLPRVIDLEKEEIIENTNLQEALKRNRPDYISSIKYRENNLLAHRMVSRNRNAILENIPSVQCDSERYSCSAKIRAKFNGNPEELNVAERLYYRKESPMMSKKNYCRQILEDTQSSYENRIEISRLKKSNDCKKNLHNDTKKIPNLDSAKKSLSNKSNSKFTTSTNDFIKQSQSKKSSSCNSTSIPKLSTVTKSSSTSSTTPKLKRSSKYCTNYESPYSQSFLNSTRNLKGIAKINLKKEIKSSIK